jgi:predicted XRE-type DNA-binding protein
MKDNSYDCIGSSLDDFLKEEGIFDECEAAAIKSVIAWQLQNFMNTQHVSKVEVARRMGTSRSLVDKVLDAKNTSITLTTISKVARVIGKPLTIGFGDNGQEVHDCPA